MEDTVHMFVAARRPADRDVCELTFQYGNDAKQTITLSRKELELLYTVTKHLNAPMGGDLKWSQ